MKPILFGAALLAAALIAPHAAAQSTQPWIKDRRFGEGAGIRAGNLELHPGIAGEFGYDSNYFQRSEDEHPVDSLRLRITPSLSLSTLGPQRRVLMPGELQPAVDFHAGLYASYNEFFGLGSNEDVNWGDQRHFDAGASFDLRVLPGRPWGFDSYGDFIRTVEPSNSSFPDFAFDRDSFRLGAGINWSPGGGLFTWRIIGYELQYHLFERTAFDNFNNIEHFINTRGRWLWLPRTAWIYDAQYGFIRYAQPLTQNNGDVIQARLGLNGLVTNHFGLLVQGGWAASFYEPTVNTRGSTIPARNYDSFVAHAEVKWYLTPQLELEPTSAQVGLSTVALGYVRNFQNSYLGAYYRRDRGYLNFEYFIGGVAVLSAEGGLSRVTYPTSFFPSGTRRFGSFGESRADVMLFGEYRVTEIFGLNLTLRYDANLTKTRIPVSETDPTAVDQLEFARYQAWIGARLFW